MIIATFVMLALTGAPYHSALYGCMAAGGKPAVMQASGPHPDGGTYLSTNIMCLIGGKMYRFHIRTERIGIEV